MQNIRAMVMMRIRRRNVAEIVQIVAVICYSFSCVQTDTSISSLVRTTSSNLLGSSNKAGSAQNVSVAMTTKTAPGPVERAHARITKVDPPYGPVSGGTKVIISGQGMTCPSDHRVNVHLVLGSTRLTAHNCSLETDTVVCLTPPRGSQGSAEFEVQVSCDGVSNGVNLWRTDDPSYSFEYKPDPIVTDVFPKESILAGGITQTVIGTNLDSVAYPQMWTGFDQDQGQPCDVQKNSTTIMLCRTQAVDVGLSSFSPNESVRSHPESLNLNGREVWIGFRLDGVTHFQRFAKLRMFHDPEFHNFNPETKVYATNEQSALSIGVTWPHMNFTPTDLTVQVGIDRCTGVQLDGNAIACHPPPLPKSVIRYGPADLNTLRVRVNIGHVTRDVGHLHYTSSEPFHVIISVMIAILAFIFVVSCSCGCCVFFGPRVGECKKGSRSKNGMQFRSDALESTPDGGKSGDGSGGVSGVGKRRGKRSGNGAPDGQGQIECVAMQYRGDASRDPQ